MKTTWKGLPLIEALKMELEHEKDQRNTEGLELIIKHIEQQQELIEEGRELVEILLQEVQSIAMIKLGTLYLEKLAKMEAR